MDVEPVSSEVLSVADAMIGESFFARFRGG
jgi:hypothetical protein